MTPVPNLVAIPVPEAVARPAPPVCVCDMDPEVFRVFAFVVLAFHRELRMADGRPWCSCGLRWSACAYARLADDILFAAAPGRDAAGAGAWR